jgi:hypothetical protein
MNCGNLIGVKSIDKEKAVLQLQKDFHSFEVYEVTVSWKDKTFSEPMDILSFQPIDRETASFGSIDPGSQLVG